MRISNTSSENVLKRLNLDTIKLRRNIAYDTNNEMDDSILLSTIKFYVKYHSICSNHLFHIPNFSQKHVSNDSKNALMSSGNNQNLNELF